MRSSRKTYCGERQCAQVAATVTFQRATNVAFFRVRIARMIRCGRVLVLPWQNLKLNLLRMHRTVRMCNIFDRASM